MKNLITVFLISVITASCTKDNETVALLKTTSEYYPQKIGSWYIYDVDSIYYNDFTDPITVDSSSYQVKEELTDTFYDLEGNLSYRITRSKRFASDSVKIDFQNWNITDIWWVKKVDNNIHRIEENNRYVSLIYPIKEGGEWDGNAFNDVSAWEYSYEKVGETYKDYADALIVNQRFLTDNKYFYQNYNEVYAKGIGLVSRTRVNMESQGQDVLNKPENGFQFFQVLNSYFIPE
jgi:hypothetical protein